MINTREIFGNIDIYLFDQIQKGRFEPGMKIFDGGCGDGRNMVWFLRNGFDISAVDASDSAIEHVRDLAASLAPELAGDNIRIGTLDSIPFATESFDWVICNAVLHFAQDRGQFDLWVAELWRVLNPGGAFFARLASSIGIKDRLVPTENGRYMMPDGTERFVVDEQMLNYITDSIGGEFIEPIKTTNVQNMRCMTTWVLRKRL